MRLKEKNAVVTGAGSGIGRAIAKGLAREGVRVVVSDIIPTRAEETVKMISNLGGKAAGVEADVTKKDQVDALYAEAIGYYQRIDISVSVTGISSTRNFLDLPEEEWDHVVDTTLKHHYLCGQVVARHMAQQGGVAIIHISSICDEVAQADYPHYVAAKGVSEC